MKLNIDTLVSIIEGSHIDITTDFNDWTKVAFALASEYGEEGRMYFHKLARLSPTYKVGENEKKYDNALKTGRKVNISTLVYIAQKNHIDVSSAYIKDITDIDTDYVFVPPLKQDKFDQSTFVGMNSEWVEKAHLIAPQSTLFKGLTNLSFLSKKSLVEEIFDEYKVGAMNDKFTAIFWQIDSQQKIRNGKTIPYKDDLHRDKTKGANWIHSIMKLQDYKFKQCPFGEHLSSVYSDAQMVFMVESEKTALICNLIYRNNSNFIWMASGGIQNLSDGSLKDLKGKFIKLFADKDAEDAWKTKCDMLVNKGYNCKLVNWREMFPVDAEIGAKDDIADMILKSKKEDLLKLRESLDKISCFG